ncbi:ParB/RepB/Spo0J family partition protein [Novispirillum itersonii]|uniref:ParB/RepB/Spo0J family partition protein n=1 Tax=Novispirillum itersonii TaxID=189 RepID=UPI00037D4803|nr:ParB/RepB/Spo0J family partition protein [Novispirillum itersonii]
MALKGWKGAGGASSVVRGEREQGTSLLPSARPEMRIHDIALTQLVPNPDQPRQVFDDAEIESLARSIRERGLLQPIVVKPMPDGTHFMIVAGERRFRATQSLGLPTIRAVWSSSNDTALDALLENCQRTNLLPLELADSLAALMGHSKMTNREAGALLGYREEQVSRLLKLRDLPDSIRADYFTAPGEISLNALYEVTMCKEADRQQQLWLRAKEGASIAELRALRQQPEIVTTDNGEGAEEAGSAPLSPAEDTVKTLRKKKPTDQVVQASIRMISKQIMRMGRMGPLNEQQKQHIRILRQALGVLIDEA